MHTFVYFGRTIIINLLRKGLLLMQNYRNNSNDYMRRGNCGHSPHTNNRMVPGTAPASIYRESSPCCDRDDALEGMPLAMAYVPWQNWRKIYEPEKAFCRGTIFEELDKPFRGIGGCQS